MARFFDRGDKAPQCEAYVDKYTQCPATYRLEADHVQPWSKGGQTEADNLITLCVVDHFIKHALDEEPYSARLIQNRMSPEELDELHRRGY